MHTSDAKRRRITRTLLVLGTAVTGCLLVVEVHASVAGNAGMICPSRRHAPQAADRTRRKELTKLQAVALACAQSPSSKSPKTVVSIASGTFRNFMSGPLPDGFSPDRRVWFVYLSGVFPPPSCGPATPGGHHPTCPAPFTTAHIVLDYHTGAFLMGSEP